MMVVSWFHGSMLRFGRFLWLSRIFSLTMVLFGPRKGRAREISTRQTKREKRGGAERVGERQIGDPLHPAASSYHAIIL